MQKLVFTNGGGQTIDLTSGNFGITNWEGLSGVGLNIQVQQVPFQDGGVFLDALMEQREISVTVAIQDNNDLSARYERKRQLISALNPKLGEGVLVYTNDYLSRQIKAVPQLPIFENKNSNDAGTLKASVVFSCPSPYWEDIEATIVTVEDTEIKQINNEGDVPIGLQIEIEGVKVTNPKITNLTTEKHIEYIGEVTTPIIIDTRIGKKQVEKTNNIFKIDNISTTVDSIDYVPFLNKIFYSCYNKGLLEGSDINQLTINYLAKQTRGLCHNNNTVVVICEDGIYATNDGVEWELVLQVEGFDCIMYSNEKNCFIATTGEKIYKSTNGTDWVEKTTIQRDRYTKILYFNNNFWLVGTGHLLYKYDGETTVTQISIASYGVCKDITTDTNSLIVLIEDSITEKTIIKQSTDGVNFDTFQTQLEPTEGIIYNDNFHSYFIFNRTTIFSSNNLIDWYAIYSNQNIYIYKLIYIPQLLYTYMLCEETFAESLNLETWNFQQKENISAIFMKYTFGKFIFGCRNYLAIKQDGVWHTVLENQNAYYNKIIKFPNSTRLLVSGNNTLYASADGENWQGLDINVDVTDMASDNNCIVIIDYINGKIVKTVDGTTFSEISLASGLSNLTIAGGENYFLMIANSNKIYKINEDLTLEEIYDFEEETVYSISYHKKLKSFVVICDTQNIYISKDGANWKKVAENISATLLSYDETLSYMYAYSRSIFYVSYDLYNWEAKNTNLRNYYNDITYDYNNNRLYLCAGSDIIYETLEYSQNEIAKITTDSDMSLNLQRGSNKFRLNKESGSFRIRLIYRQKYIGV